MSERCNDWDDLAIAFTVRERDADDDGTRLTLDELFAEHGYDRAAIERAVRKADQP